jgi:hypothetical protein
MRCSAATRKPAKRSVDYIKATVGFEKLGEATGAPPKSLIRMFGPRGNPQARNLFNVIGYLQKRAGLQLHVTGQWGGTEVLFVLAAVLQEDF